MINTIQKRDGTLVPYNSEKIKKALLNANKDVEQIEDKITESEINMIIEYIEFLPNKCLEVEIIQDIVEKQIMELKKYELAKQYIIYREKHSIKRIANTTDHSMISLIQYKNEELKTENSNKNPLVLSTQRDYIAGETSKDISDRILLPPRIVKAHKECIFHFHDKDYFMQKGMINCCLDQMGDMLQNKTVMQDSLIESPKSFQVACNVMTQIIAAIASNQYGGQSVDTYHLGKYLRKTKFKALVKYLEKGYSREEAEDLAQDRMIEDLKSGVQTIHYQINTLMTTNGQSPFVTLFMYMRENDPYAYENALIIEEILKQRIKGIKNKKNTYVTPAFPKLVYVLDENNIFEGGKYDYLSELAALCSIKRMYPDYISAKQMKKEFDGEVFSCMGCRSFLSPWKDENGKYKWEGRFNQGVVSLNLPQIGLIANKDMNLFWKLLDERLELCYEALMFRHNSLLGTLSDVSPIHWQHGAIARLKPGEVIDPYLKDGYSTISLGYIGLYELTIAMIGESHTTENGKKFALEVMNYMKNMCEKWKAKTGLGFGLYGTPAESLSYRFAKSDKERFGSIKDITDKDYYTNSYHIDVREKISAFDKLSFESQFQPISSGGCISYIEMPNMNHNPNAIKTLMKYIYNNIKYAEFNTKSDFCHVCNYTGEIKLDNENNWECPNCHNQDKEKMSVVRRTCGYLGANWWNEGKTHEIFLRELHL